MLVNVFVAAFRRQKAGRQGGHQGTQQTVVTQAELDVLIVDSPRLQAQETLRPFETSVSGRKLIMLVSFKEPVAAKSHFDTARRKRECGDYH